MFLPASGPAGGEVLACCDGNGNLDWQSGLITNPMNAQGDIIIGGLTGPGAPTRLGMGTNGKFLRAGSSSPQYGWENVSSTMTSNYTISNNDGYDTILADASGGSFTITLPSPGSNVGRAITIKRQDAGYQSPNYYTLTISSSPQTIDGASSNTLHSQ
jgi:hypothetical protein